MVSRLDRLFILLDSGSNESVRLAAAKQLGEVQKIQPDDLEYLVTRIKEYSGKSLWETRVAAGQATRCVLEQVGPWPIPSLLIDNTGEDKLHTRVGIAENLVEQNIDCESILQQFDLERIMSMCPKLLSLDESNVDDAELVNPSTSKTSSSKSSRGTRKDSVSSRKNKNDKEQLLRQRKLINKELGLMDSLNFGVKSTDIVSNDDLQTTYSELKEPPCGIVKSSSNQQDVRLTIHKSLSNYDSILNMLYEHDCISKPNLPPDDDMSATSKDKLEQSQTTHCNKLTNVTDLWPLSDVTRQYTDDLFNPSWEIRHGAAIALREIVKLQGAYAGKLSKLSDSANNKLNQIWLIDMALKALCVLALDKFGDFLFDQVVAPVRENAAQLLGCCLSHMSETNVFLTIKLILQILQNGNWETRHGGVLGLKYYLSIIKDESFSQKILQECYDPIFKCLADPVDDVSAEAAASLVPMKDLLIKTIPEKTPTLIKFLWDHLAELDELTTSTSNIVLLLASLITSSSSQVEVSELTKSIPRLWSLLGHPSSTVRISVLKALVTLFKTQKSSCLSWMLEDQITTLLRLLFQRSILENMEEVRCHIEEVWMLMMKIDRETAGAQTNQFNLLKCTSQYLNYWLCLIMQPYNTPIDRGSEMWLNIRPDGSKSSAKPDGEIYIGSCSFNAETIDQQKQQITKCRLLATKLLGFLYANLVEDLGESQHNKETLKYLSDMFTHYIKTKSANQRIICGWTVESWACHQAALLAQDYRKLKEILPNTFTEQLNSALQETSLYYDELATTFTRLQQETRNFVSSLREANIHLTLPHSIEKRIIYNLNQIQSLCDLNLEAEMTKLVSKKNQSNQNNQPDYDFTKSETYTALLTRKLNLTKSLRDTNLSQKVLTTSVLSSLAIAHISWRLIPDNLKLVVQPLLDSIELEEEQPLQDKSINYLVTLFDILCCNKLEHEQLLNGIFKELLNILSCKETIQIQTNSVGDNENINRATPYSSNSESNKNSSVIKTKSDGDNCKIILLDNLQRKAELTRFATRRQSSINSTSNLKRSHSLTSAAELEVDSMPLDDNSNSQNTDKINIKRRGASTTLSKLVSHFGETLPEKLPLFWRHITTDIKSQIEKINNTGEIGSQNENELIKNLTLLEVVGESLDIKLRDHLLSLFPFLIKLLESSNPYFRHHSAKCIGLISKLMLVETTDHINKEVIPMLEQGDNILARCGAVETIAFIIEYLQMDLVPRINMFIIHVLRRMSDQNDQIRLMATHCFGKLLSLMPLNLEKSKQLDNTVEKSSIDQVSNSDDNHRFIEQLLDPKKLDSYVIPFELDAKLRSYQQDGLNWLAFLNRYNLHGILCDEMGLGKTLMTICMVASDHYETKKEKQQQTSASCPSLIVCPPTLTEHWLYEIDKFLDARSRSILNPVAYSGNLNDRMNLRIRIISALNRNKENAQLAPDCSKQPDTNLIVASYDIVRNDIEFFKDVNWNYVVLDEGHIIKNGKTKLAKAIRQLTAKHRLVLSGTPIQNNITELWSLFDFLMPGFLGSERQFNSRYTKPILQSREPKSSSRDLEAGVLAMESLHRQVLPFILRRLKEDVLDDLPPKIIQDYYCELSALQLKLYEDFTRSKLCKEVTKKSIMNLEEEDSDITASSKNHVFQALQYLKNVCNHPKLVLAQKHSQFVEITKSLENDRSSLDDIVHSSKLKALKQLLIDCGIGVINQMIPGEESSQQQQSMGAVESVVNQHRALVFCQVRSMVNIIENDLLKKHLPSVTYLRLDGSIPANQRQSIISRFNNDPSIDILLLTTQIGGLGLNLTGADTVIFVEHDWNPTKDLQAMDRAHRIGQKKVVNVYRLITKGTLEEKIMGLQKFKTMVSNTVINQDNAGLGTMNVNELFDLFNNDQHPISDNGASIASSGKSGDTLSSGKKKSSSFMELLPELWNQQQYETEYDLSNFVSSLKN